MVLHRNLKGVIVIVSSKDGHDTCSFAQYERPKAVGLAAPSCTGTSNDSVMP